MLKACLVGDLFKVVYTIPPETPVGRWALMGGGTWLVSDILPNDSSTCGLSPLFIANNDYSLVIYKVKFF